MAVQELQTDKDRMHKRGPKQMKSPLLHCSECGQHLDKLTEGGRYLQRTSPIGEDFKGRCAPACEYHELRADGATALKNCLNDNA